MTKTIEKIMLNGTAYQVGYDSKITIKKNGTKVDDFTLNQSSDKNIDISVPTNSDYVDLTTAQSVGGVKTFTSAPVVPSKTSDATNSGTAVATEAQVYKKQDALTLPATPTSGHLVTWGANNKTLADGGAIPSYSTITTADFNTGTSTTAGLTTAKDVADYVTGKVSNAYVYKGSVSTYGDLPSTGNVTGDVYNVETAHTTDPKFPAGSNVAWNGTTWDVLGGIFDTSSFVDITSNQTIGGTKTFSTSPVVPSKTATATNTGTAIATEAQVYSVAQSIPTVNNATLTLKQGGTSKGTFTANASSAVTVDFNTSFMKTDTEYTNLPATKSTDGNFYFIYADDAA